MLLHRFHHPLSRQPLGHTLQLNKRRAWLHPGGPLRCRDVMTSPARHSQHATQTYSTQTYSTQTFSTLAYSSKITAPPAAAAAARPPQPVGQAASRRRRGSGEGESAPSPPGGAPAVRPAPARSLGLGSRPCSTRARAPPTGVRRTGKRRAWLAPGAAGWPRSALRGCTGALGPERRGACAERYFCGFRPGSTGGDTHCSTARIKTQWHW
jgi:hypothetical protein